MFIPSPDNGVISRRLPPSTEAISSSSSQSMARVMPVWTCGSVSADLSCDTATPSGITDLERSTASAASLSGTMSDVPPSDHSSTSRRTGASEVPLRRVIL